MIIVLLLQIVMPNGEPKPLQRYKVPEDTTFNSEETKSWGEGSAEDWRGISRANMQSSDAAEVIKGMGEGEGDIDKLMAYWEENEPLINPKGGEIELLVKLKPHIHRNMYVEGTVVGEEFISTPQGTIYFSDKKLSLSYTKDGLYKIGDVVIKIKGDFSIGCSEGISCIEGINSDDKKLKIRAYGPMEVRVPDEAGYKVDAAYVNELDDQGVPIQNENEKLRVYVTKEGEDVFYVDFPPDGKASYPKDVKDFIMNEMKTDFHTEIIGKNGKKSWDLVTVDGEKTVLEDGKIVGSLKHIKNKIAFEETLQKLGISEIQYSGLFENLRYTEEGKPDIRIITNQQGSGIIWIRTKGGGEYAFSFDQNNLKKGDWDDFWERPTTDETEQDLDDSIEAEIKAVDNINEFLNKNPTSEEIIEYANSNYEELEKQGLIPALYPEVLSRYYKSDKQDYSTARWLALTSTRIGLHQSDVYDDLKDMAIDENDPDRYYAAAYYQLKNINPEEREAASTEIYEQVIQFYDNAFQEHQEEGLSTAESKYYGIDAYHSGHWYGDGNVPPKIRQAYLDVLNSDLHLGTKIQTYIHLNEQNKHGQKLGDLMEEYETELGNFPEFQRVKEDLVDKDKN